MRNAREAGQVPERESPLRTEASNCGPEWRGLFHAPECTQSRTSCRGQDEQAISGNPYRYLGAAASRIAAVASEEPGVVGRNITRLLRETGLGQAELVRRSGVPRSTITSLQSGATKDATTDLVKKLARGFGVPITELTAERPEEAELDAFIAEFKASPWAQTLLPPFSLDDERWMRHMGRIEWTGERPPPAAIKLFIEANRIARAATRDDD